MLVEFGKSGYLAKAKQQPDKVKQVLDKIKSDGLLPTLETVFKKAPEGAAVLVLADDYPQKTSSINDTLISLAEKKNIRLYVEFTQDIPGIAAAAPKNIEFERGIISSDIFGDQLKKMRIVMIPHPAYS